MRLAAALRSIPESELSLVLSFRRITLDIASQIAVLGPRAMMVNSSVIRRLIVWILALTSLGTVGVLWQLNRSNGPVNPRNAAQQALKRRDFAAAQEYLEQCIRLAQDDPELWLMAARTARRVGQFKLFFSFIRSFERHGGDSDSIQREISLLQLQNGDIKEARKLLERCKEHPDAPESELILEAMLEGTTKALMLGHSLGKSIPVDIFADERLLARQAVDCWLTQRTTPQDQAQGLLWRGRARYFNGEHAAAVADIRRALELDPNNFAARYHLANFIGQEAPDEATVHIRQLLRQDPSNLQLKFSLASGLRSLGQNDEAKTLLDELLRVQPTHEAALTERGKLALDERRLVDAELWLRRALDASPNLADAHGALVRCLLQAGRDIEAQTHLSRFQQIEANENRRGEELLQKLKENRSKALRPGNAAGLSTTLIPSSANSDLKAQVRSAGRRLKRTE